MTPAKTYISPYVYPAVVQNTKRYGNVIKVIQPTLLVDKVAQKVCEYFSLTIEQLKDKTRKRTIVEKRQMVIYLCRKKGIISEDIASYLHQDRTTIIDNYQRVCGLLEVDEAFCDRMNEVEIFVNGN